MEEPDNRIQYEVLGDDEKIYGPESYATIKRWHSEGRLNDQSKIRRVNETNWHSVSSCKEFQISAPETNESVPVSMEPPGVILWYRIYCALMGVLYALLVILFLFLRSLPDIEQVMNPSEYTEFQITSMVVIIFGVPFAILYFACVFMASKRWHWVLGIISIGLGMTGCCLPVCIPLLIFWIKPETKSWLSRNE